MQKKKNKKKYILQLDIVSPSLRYVIFTNKHEKTLLFQKKDNKIIIIQKKLILFLLKQEKCALIPPTHIPQLDRDAPEQDDPGPDNPEPALNHDPDLDPDPVFNSIIC